MERERGRERERERERGKEREIDRKRKIDSKLERKRNRKDYNLKYVEILKELFVLIDLHIKPITYK